RDRTRVSETPIAMRSKNRQLSGLLFAAAITFGGFACGIAVRRDYSTIPPGQVGFDDMCGLQDYFDTLEARQAAEPFLVSAVDVEGQASKPIRGGKNLYRFETDFQLKHLRRVLNENWKGLPEQLPAANAVDLEVHWSEK